MYGGNVFIFERQCDSFSVFSPRCSGRKDCNIMFVPRATPFPLLCTRLSTVLPPLAASLSETLARHQWQKTSHHKFFWWSKMREEHLVEIIFIHLPTHRTFAACTQTYCDGLKWEVKPGPFSFSLIIILAILSLNLPSPGFYTSLC